MEPTNILQQLGCTANESAMYFAALELGEAPARAIAERAGIPRTYAYDLLQGLAERGFISYVERNPGTRKYAAVSPKRLEKILTSKLEKFREFLPELESHYQGAAQRPRVRFFEGKDGIERIHDEILEEAKEIFFFGSTKDWVRSFSNSFEFTKAFVEAGITVNDLVADLPETRAYAPLYHGTKSQLRFIRQDWDFQSDFVLWNNKVALHSYASGDMHAVVIESAPIAGSIRTIFNILWKLGKNQNRGCGATPPSQRINH